MNRMMTDLFDAWAGQAGIEGGAAFGLNTDGMAALEIDQGIVVNFQARSSPPLLVLFALVGPLPDINRTALVEELLEANLMWMATNGATLSLQRAADGAAADVVIAQTIAVHQGTAFTELQRVFDNLCLVALDWKARLENLTCQPTEVSDPHPPQFGYSPPLV